MPSIKEIRKAHGNYCTCNKCRYGLTNRYEKENEGVSDLFTDVTGSINRKMIDAEDIREDYYDCDQWGNGER